MKDIAFMAFVVLGMGFGAYAMVSMYRAIALRKPCVDLLRDTWFSPANLLFMPSKLTNEGLAARKRFFASLIAFICCLLGAMFSHPN